MERSIASPCVAIIVHLPEIGIRGNTHFPFSDMNNAEVAELMSKFLRDKGWIE